MAKDLSRMSKVELINHIRYLLGMIHALQVVIRKSNEKCAATYGAEWDGTDDPTVECSFLR